MSCKLCEHHTKKSENTVIDMMSRLTGFYRTRTYRIKSEFKSFGSFSSPGKKRSSKRNQNVARKIWQFHFKYHQKKGSRFLFQKQDTNRTKHWRCIPFTRIYYFFSPNSSKYFGSLLIRVCKKNSEFSSNWKRRHHTMGKTILKKYRKIYSTCEIWINFGCMKSKIWKDTAIKISKEAFLSGLWTVLKALHAEEQD